MFGKGKKPKNKSGWFNCDNCGDTGSYAAEGTGTMIICDECDVNPASLKNPVCGVCNDQEVIIDMSFPEGERAQPCPGCMKLNLTDSQLDAIAEGMPDELKERRAAVDNQPVALTQGQYLVDMDFSESCTDSPAVIDIKSKTSVLMDMMHEFMLAQMEDGGNDAAGRCAAVALSKYEEASMWAVKALTKPPMGV